MSKDLFSRYVWLMDTIRRYGKISLRELNRRWVESPVGDGNPIQRRSFYNYRQQIEMIFNVNIGCDPVTYEYYIIENDSHNQSVTDWLLNSTATSNVLSGARDVSNKIFLENVPSARDYLHVVIDALRSLRQLKFSYHPYTRSTPKPGVVVEPYFLKIFRQRWYVTGRNVADGQIKTYALDRMKDVVLLDTTFVIPENFDAETYCGSSFGIVFDMGEVKKVVLKVEQRQAKYFRTLPLHSSQVEMVHNGFSMFHYTLRLTPDFVQEILSYGPRVTVIEPPELRSMVLSELHRSLENYGEKKSPGVKK